MFLLNGKKIDIARDLTIGDGPEAITYPAASLLDPNLRASIGITEQAEEPRPDDRWYWVADNGNGTYMAIEKDIAGLRTEAIDAIKAQRQAALDRFPKSSGVSEIYAENLIAARAIKAGTGDTTIMRDGSTAVDYMTHMAVGMGITVEAFADYVIAENVAAAVKVREIEAEYVRLAYTHIPACSFDQVQTVRDAFSRFCAERVPS